VATTAYKVDDEIIDTNGNIERVITAGTSGSTEPTWPATYATVTSDGTSGLQWQQLSVPQHIGASDGPATIHFECKLEEVQADQVFAPIDMLVTAESAYFEFTLKEFDLRKLAQVFAHPTYSIGTDTGLPSGFQSFQKLTTGGFARPPFRAVAIVSKRRYYSAAYLVSCMYKAGAKNPLSYTVTKNKELMNKVRFDGFADLGRSEGDQVCQLYRTGPSAFAA